MREVSTIGQDLAKSGFPYAWGGQRRPTTVQPQHLKGEAGVVLCRAAEVHGGMETCGGSHYRARELQRMGHEVRLIAPKYVKPYAKRQKNDAADAAAICEAAQRPTMRSYR